MAHQITNIKATSNKSKMHTVRPSFTGSYLVTSAASGAPVACSHVQATLAFVEAQDGYKAKFFAQHEDVSHHHRRVVELGNGVKATVRKTAVKPQPSGDEIDDWFSYG